MENFGKRTILLLSAAFVIVNLCLIIYLAEANRVPTTHCDYHGHALICTTDER